MTHQYHCKIHISSTLQVIRLLGLEAAKRKVKAYIRFVPAVYQSPDKGFHDEKEALKPFGDLGIWVHESLRVLGNMKEYVFIVVLEKPCVDNIATLV